MWFNGFRLSAYMRHRRTRKWDHSDEDPTSGLINLFDIWMVFAVAVLIAFVQVGALRTATAKSAAGPSQSPSETPRAQTRRVTKMRLTTDQLTGEGYRLGTAYRLKSGEVVYVPDTATQGVAQP
jgi:hypothetical protein